ncbi:MAG: heme-binding protein [Steroidobacteraceae bacterium]
MTGRAWAIVKLLLMMSLSTTAFAQDYLLPNAPGKKELTTSCEICHGIEAIVKHRRSAHQWDDMVNLMIQRGAPVTEEQKKVMLTYLKTYFVQDRDYIPIPSPYRGRGPGLALALEAAETAQKTCHDMGLKTTALVVDVLGNPIVLLTGDGMQPMNAAIDATKVAAVLRYKEPSGVTMKRMDSDPELVEEVRNDPAIGQVLQGGLPIVANGELIGAIALSGAQGPADTDEKCAKAGLAKIASRLR